MSIGWGILAYELTAGVAFGLALVFFLFGARALRFDALMTSLGLYAFTLGLASITTVRLHTASNADDYARWLKIFGLLGLTGFVALVILVAVWTTAVPRWAMWVLGVATTVIAVLQLASPNGLLAGDIERLRDVELFGDRFLVHDATAASWRPVLDVYLLTGFAMIIVAVVRGYRLGLRRHSVLMGAALAISIAFSYYDSLVDFGRVQTPYLLPFGSLAVVIAGAVFLAERSIRTDTRLLDQTARLEEIVIERTAALIESNRRLEDQLARQRESTRHLKSLTEQFEQTNEIVDPHPPTIEDSLVALIEQLGKILHATSVELRIDDDRVETVLPRTVAWPRRAPTGVMPDPRSDDTAGTVTELSETIRIGTRIVGRLTAWTTDDRINRTDGSQYLGLVVEHLSGLIQRLDVVAQLADSAAEGERQRIAMELHDSVTQRMYSVSFLADAAVHQAAHDPAGTGELVQRIRELVLSSLAELHELLLELRPHSFAEAELHVLLRQLADNLASTWETEVVAEVSAVASLPTTVKTALYRIGQEAASNACRHSQADEITIRLIEDADLVTLVICDDGVGFDASAVTTGTGLDNLRARAHLIDASIDVSSHPGSGTAVTVRLARPVAATKTLSSAQAVDV